MFDLLAKIAASPLAALLGGVAGGLVGAVVLGITWWWDSQRREAREIIQSGLRVHESHEAWILENAEGRALSELRSLPLRLEPSATEPWLRRVEVRLALDPETWNAPTNPFFAVIEGRRTWIVRDRVDSGDSYQRTQDIASLPSYPALLSSKALHELAANTELLSSLFIWRLWPLPMRQEPILRLVRPEVLWALRPFVASLYGEDRLSILQSRLSERCIRFLRWYGRKFGPPPAGQTKPRETAI